MTIDDATLEKLTARLAGTAERYDRSGDFPVDGITAVFEAGLLHAEVGARTSLADAVRIFAALGRGDPSVALLTAMTFLQHRAQATAPWWPDALYAQVVADSAERPVLLNAIRAEPEWGAPARGGLPATTIRRTPDGWSLTGHKGFATGVEGLAYHLVWAATEDDEPLLAHAIVPADAPGIEIVRTWDHLGLRASGTHDVIYTDVRVPEENFRGTPPQNATQSAGLAVSALYLGVAQAARDFFVKFANERVPSSLGRPIATTERIQSVAGEIETQLVHAEELLTGLAPRIDAGDPAAIARVPVAKVLVTRAVIAAVQTAVAALGNPALTRHHPLERHLRDVLASRVHPPQEDAALLIAGRRALAAVPR
ncbi:acyl-CoA dehydrogenase family protein [Catenuloplanes sp. NPDC051500]|uniref:acyl-CoA dehydrogenase family protein n=1 Tax=Catenuloplanes sp. NPDC051500 TaxID=3363959 RepID=UPI0037ABD6F4